MAKRQLIRTAAKIWKKARGKDPRYLAWKAANHLARRARKYRRRFVRHNLTDGAVLALLRQDGKAGLRDLLAQRTRFSFFVTTSEVDLVLLKLEQHDPSYRESVIERAERIMQHRLPVLSTDGEMYLGRQIDWHRDYCSGLRWEAKYAFDYDVLDFDRPSDVRVTWELNRLHFLVDLAKAYRITNEERYASKIVELVIDWDVMNPFEYSVNWTCAMDAAIRAVNLIWALMLALPSSSFDDHFVARLIRILLEHGRHIRENLEYSDVRGNHYLSDLVGLIYIGLFLPESRNAQAWLKFALPRFEYEMLHQVYPDGVDHEGSIPYHRLVTELFLSTMLLLQRNGYTLSRQFQQRLERMIDFVAAYTKPDGSCPMFGDADDGRLHVLGHQDINDHRYLLSVGAVQWERSDFKVLAGCFWEEAAWLLGPAGWDKFEALPSGTEEHGSKAFPHGGFYFLRSGDDQISLDCGDVGLRGRGGHGHCDILSLDIVLQGENIVVDRGAAQYTASRSLRREVIGAASHNTTIVDGEDFARIVPYDIATVENTRGKMLTWKASNMVTIFAGEHYGYADKRITHYRRVELYHGESRVLIVDQLRGGGEHQVEARFHLAPGSRIDVVGSECLISTAGGRVVRFRMASSLPGVWAVQPTAIFPRYGFARESLLLKWSGTFVLPVELRIECRIDEKA